MTSSLYIPLLYGGGSLDRPTKSSDVLSTRCAHASAMDYAACHVIYVDRMARADRLVKKDATPSVAAGTYNSGSGYFDALGETDQVQANVRTILAVFDQGTPGF